MSVTVILTCASFALITPIVIHPPVSPDTGGSFLKNIYSFSQSLDISWRRRAVSLLYKHGHPINPETPNLHHEKYYKPNPVPWLFFPQDDALPECVPGLHPIPVATHRFCPVTYDPPSRGRPFGQNYGKQPLVFRTLGPALALLLELYALVFGPHDFLL